MTIHADICAADGGPCRPHEDVDWELAPDWAVRHAWALHPDGPPCVVLRRAWDLWVIAA